MRSNQLWMSLSLVVAVACGGCESKKPSGTDGTAKGTAAGVAEPVQPAVPDDAEIVSAIESTQGVVVQREGENIVTLNLLGLLPKDNETLVEEFAWTKGLPLLRTLCM